VEKLDPYLALGGRILLSFIFIVAGFSKIASGGEGMVQYMESAGVPGFLFWPAALFEVIAGLAILVGFKTRISAFLLAGFCIVTAVLFHYVPADQMQMTMLMKNFAIAGGLLILARFGAGEFSVDGRASEPSED
jgi:putative oxidoreductase